jgi:glucosamine--fructose-6-phosphate aminotransferase (isomerizing)
VSLREEIGEQPEVVRHALEANLGLIERIAAAIRERDCEFVLIAARGTSDHAAIYGQYVLGARNGFPVALAAPSLVSRFGARPRLRRALVIGISQSGGSPDVLAVLNEGRSQGALTLALTNDPGSELAGAAEWAVDVRAGVERSIAATKTYTAELLALAMLSAALAGETAANDAARRSADQAALASLPDRISRALDAEATVAKVAASRADKSNFVVLGRGYDYATAREWALKLKEMAGVFAEGYSSADFQHGPVAIVGPGLPVLAIAPAGLLHGELAELLAALRSERGADVIVLTDEPGAVPGADILPLAPSTPDWLDPLVAIVPAQLFCYHLALARGRDPEAPPGLRKVTRTL